MSRKLRGIALVFAASVSAGPALASGPVCTEPVRFAAMRNGAQIGSHTVQFARDGERIKAITSIALRVDMLGIAFYRYSHSAEEIWQGDTLLSLVSRTDDNGTQHRVRASRQGNDLQVWRSASAEPNQPDRVHDGTGTTTLMAGNSVATTHWNVRQVGQSRLLNSQVGTPMDVRVEAVGTEPVGTAAGIVQARRYRYSGDLVKDHWFDPRNCWTKTAFSARDGSRIDYVLRP